ncbi:hypothetical protein WS95_29675 [Burkholderia sp. MSMB1826]|nr:hypothetical protein WS95_29675 [Burkholderia sp. MSMB1826]KWE49914.1 hypothetical protein WT53_31135 [Burkholderia sp. MSMB2157WGS]
MNQGKKSFAHRSAPLKTQNRRVLPATCSTICGAIGHGAARPADGRRATAAGSPPVRRFGGSGGVHSS